MPARLNELQLRAPHDPKKREHAVTADLFVWIYDSKNPNGHLVAGGSWGHAFGLAPLLYNIIITLEPFAISSSFPSTFQSI